ncbi:MAG TPA: nicotinamide riboside transporter PnuC [Bacteroidales bacterium]|nr:nicotinamide riboside transporter PnuC [Bacteroidales bacterium]
MNWLSDHYIEVFGALTGIIYVILEIRQSIWLWPLGLITSVIYIWVFFTSKFYADMGLQTYYVLISIYGWYWWLKGGKKYKKDSLPVTNISMKLAAILLFVFLALFVLIWFILVKYTDSPIPIGDAFTTALSVVATWMLARKIIEHWVLWIIADLVSIGLYIYKGLFPTVILFAVYTVMAVIGFREWRKTVNMEYGITELENQERETLNT